MLRRPTGVLRARYQPFALALQSRFKFRHRDFDPWRRLMDATCFVVDWIGRPPGPNLSQYGGHWSHIVTCAHVLTPWNYPNFYPPVGASRYVSRLTLADTATQLRVPSLQGDVIYRHFLSQHHTYIHTDLKVDLAVAHCEQNFKRSGEMKLLWIQNEGYALRPRLEVLEELQIGDIVWLNGTEAHGDIFDEEAPVDPLMVPTGIRGRVVHLEADHFFIDTNVDPNHREVGMGLCGSPIIKDGKCFGMLTATVHIDSENKKLAGTAMCTYARDIRAFLMEVEQQMKNPMPNHIMGGDTVFEKRREAEFEAGLKRRPKVHKDWDADEMRLARHIKVPASHWKQQEDWTTEEDKLNSAVYGRTGAFSQEVQEDLWGLNMNESDSEGKNVNGAKSYRPGGEKMHEEGVRPDTSPPNVFLNKDKFVTLSEWDTEGGKLARDGMKAATEEGASGADMDKLRRSIEALQRRKDQERREKETVDAIRHEKASVRGSREYEEFGKTTTPNDPAEEPGFHNGGFGQRRPQKAAPAAQRSPRDNSDLDGLWEQH